MEPQHVARPYREASWGDTGTGWRWSAACSCGWSWGQQTETIEPAARAATVHAADALAARKREDVS